MRYEVIIPGAGFSGLAEHRGFVRAQHIYFAITHRIQKFLECKVHRGWHFAFLCPAHRLANGVSD